MSYPQTYFDWCEVLEKFGDNDDDQLAVMAEGSFSVDAGTARRFFAKVEETYRKRKEHWLTSFQGSIAVNSINKLTEFEILIRGANRKLAPIYQFVCLKSMPKEVAEVLKNDFENFITEIKKSLNASFDKHSSVSEQFLIMANSIGDMKQSLTTENTTPVTNRKYNSGSGGRKIIL